MTRPLPGITRAAGSSEGQGRVTIENVNYPGVTSTADAALYHAMRDAIIRVLPAMGPGLTLAEVREALEEHLPAHLFPGGARAGWWFKTVQLDLEAKGVIARQPSKPLRLRRNS